MKFALGFKYSELAAGGTVENQNILRQQAVGGLDRGEFARAAFGKNKIQGFPPQIQFFGGLQTRQPQRQMVLIIQSTALV